MKKSTKLIALVAVLVAVSAAAFGVSRYEAKQEEVRATNDTILAIDPDTVTALSWEYDETSLAFHKDGSWVYDTDSAFPVSENAVDALLEQFREFDAAFTIDNVEDYGQYGLEDPACTICLTAGGTDYEIKLGDFSTLDEERYVSIGDGKVYLAAADPMDAYEITLSDMIENDELPSISDAEEIVFSGSENYTIDYEEDSPNTWCSEDVYFTDDQPLDTNAVRSYLTALSNIPLTEYAGYNASEEDLAAWGLSDPELTAEITYIPEDEDSEDTEDTDAEAASEEEEAAAEPVTFTVSVGRNQEELAAWEAAQETAEDESSAEDIEALTADDEDTEDSGDSDGTDDEELTVTCYLRLDDSPIVYIISEDSYNSLMAAAYNDLRHDTLMTADFEDVTSIDITLDGTTYTLTSEMAEDEDAEESEDAEDGETPMKQIWHYGSDEEIDCTSLLNAIHSLSTQTFTDEAPTEKEEISFTFHLDNENCPELTLSLYRYDGTSCIAELNGEPTAYVLRSSVSDIIELVYELVL